MLSWVNIVDTADNVDDDDIDGDDDDDDDDEYYEKMKDRIPGSIQISRLN